MLSPEPPKSKVNVCPFCGETVLNLTVKREKNFIVGWIKCSHCQAQGPEARELVCLAIDTVEIKEKIVELWNQAPRIRRKKK